ncbi:uncharacterized protein LOC134705200 [Mytilus trossulus]|uniref:uncharacterized protein LOC134705200 n=1 Tax=Mytilus trossulus TaxID=6551 RepID=UPI0030063BB7
MTPNRIMDFLNGFSHVVAQEGTAFMEVLYFSPKRSTDELSKKYYLYILPILLVIFITWQIILLRSLKSDDFMKKSGIMAIYTSLDLVCFVIQDITLISALSLKENYVQYECCYVFEIGATLMPGFIFSFSQWLKVLQSCQKYIILEKPFTYKSYFTNIKVATYVTIMFFLSFVFAVFRFLFLDFEKVFHLDKQSGEVIAVCRDASSFSSKNKRNEFGYKVLHISEIVFSGFLPVLFFVVLSILTIRKLRQQMKFRKNNKITKSNIVSSLERISIITTAVTAFYVISSAPTIIFPLIQTISEESTFLNFTQYLTIITNVLMLSNTPVTLFMFSWLYMPFRNTVKKVVHVLCTFLSRIHCTSK